MSRTLNFTLAEHEMMVSKFIETVRSHALINLCSIINGIYAELTIADLVTNLKDTNQVLINGVHVLLDFDKIAYFHHKECEVGLHLYKGTASDWLKKRVMLYSMVNSKLTGAPITEEVKGLRKAILLDRVKMFTLGNTLALQPIIAKLLILYINDQLAIGTPEKGIYYKCNPVGQRVTFERYSDAPKLFVKTGVSMHTNDAATELEEEFSLYKFFEEREDQTWCNRFHAELSSIIDKVGYGIVKLHLSGDFVTVFIGDDSRALLWHQNEIERLEEERDKCEQRGNL